MKFRWYIKNKEYIVDLDGRPHTILQYYLYIIFGNLSRCTLYCTHKIQMVRMLAVALLFEDAGVKVNFVLTMDILPHTILNKL